MSHEVETMGYAFDADSKDEAFSHPWHISMTQAISRALPRGLSPTEFSNLSGLRDWNVETVPTYVFDGITAEKSGLFALVRKSDGKVLGHSSENWVDNSNENMADWLEQFVPNVAEMSTMGSICGGTMVFATLKIKGAEFSLLNGRDEIHSYLHFFNPHQYGKSMTIGYGNIRVVCKNTFNAALKDSAASHINLSHHKAFDGDHVNEVLGLADDRMNAFRDAAEFLASKRFTVDAMMNYYREVFPRTGNAKTDAAGDLVLGKQAQMAHDVLDTQPGAELGEGSWWQVFNSATYMVDHLSGRNDANRFENSLVGSGKQSKIKALNKALDFANAS